nr:MAG TPA: hypothetical protein [Caudoviricetes sp.]
MSARAVREACNSRNCWANSELKTSRHIFSSRLIAP